MQRLPVFTRWLAGLGSVLLWLCRSTPSAAAAEAASASPIDARSEEAGRAAKTNIEFDKDWYANAIESIAALERGFTRVESDVIAGNRQHALVVRIRDGESDLRIEPRDPSGDWALDVSLGSLTAMRSIDGERLTVAVADGDWQVTNSAEGIVLRWDGRAGAHAAALALVAQGLGMQIEPRLIRMPDDSGRDALRVEIQSPQRARFNVHLQGATTHVNVVGEAMAGVEHYSLLLTSPSGTVEWGDLGFTSQLAAAFGASVATAGDVNADGYGDVLVGAPGFSPVFANSGAALLFLGKEDGLETSPEWVSLGWYVDHRWGASVSAAGDINLDGWDDVVVGAPGMHMSGDDVNNEPRRGAAFLYTGNLSGMQQGGTQQNSSEHLLGYGEEYGDAFGSVVAWIGMSGTNADAARPMIAVSAPFWDDTSIPATDAGKVYFYSWDEVARAPSFRGSVPGDQANAHFGASVSSAGDVDADRYWDSVVGEPEFDNASGIDAGRVSLIKGASGYGIGDRSPIVWTAEGDAAGKRLGESVSLVGDANGDGFCDWAAGAPGVGYGAAYAWAGGTTYPGGDLSSAFWSATGQSNGSEFGARISTAGDLNGDGYGDLVVAAPLEDNWQTDEGAVSVYLGGPDGLSGTPVWTAYSGASGTGFGESVATCDTDGDGFSDIVVGAPSFESNPSGPADGAVFVYRGEPSRLSETSNWARAGGAAGILSGYSVSTAGDVNGDGFSDVVVGVPTYDAGSGKVGAALVFFGGPRSYDYGSSGWWQGLKDTTADVVLISDQVDSWFGWVVSTAGDFDADGYDDIVVGAPYYDHSGAPDAGKVFLYRGSASGTTTTPIELVGPVEASGRFGYDIAWLGNANWDKFSDVAVGVPGYSGGVSSRGHKGAFAISMNAAKGELRELDGTRDVVGDHAYPLSLAQGAIVVFDGTDGTPTPGGDWMEVGPSANIQFGCFLSGVSDVNGDGFADLVAGTPAAASGAGGAYLYLGSPQGLGSAVAGWPAAGAHIAGQFGACVAAAGDVNGDGYSDVLVGAPALAQQGVLGTVHLFLGSAVGLAGSPAWTATGLADGDAFGATLTGLADVTGDGRDEIVVGARRTTSTLGSKQGLIAVYYSQATGLPPTTPDWIRFGEAANAQFGSSLDGWSDVDADGAADLIASAPFFTGSVAAEGKVYAYHGNGAGGMDYAIRGGGPLATNNLAGLLTHSYVQSIVRGRSAAGMAWVSLEWEWDAPHRPWSIASREIGDEYSWGVYTWDSEAASRVLWKRRGVAPA